MQKLFCASVLLLTILLFLDNGYSLSCYECRTDVDEGCNEPFNQSFSKECKEKSPAYCRKIHQKLRFNGQKSYTSIRECAYNRDSSGCYFYKWYLIASMETCECNNKDNCNRGSSRIPGIITVVFSVLWILVHFKSNGT